MDVLIFMQAHGDGVHSCVRACVLDSCTGSPCFHIGTSGCGQLPAIVMRVHTAQPQQQGHEVYGGLEASEARLLRARQH